MFHQTLQKKVARAVRLRNLDSIRCVSAFVLNSVAEIHLVRCPRRVQANPVRIGVRCFRSLYCLFGCRWNDRLVGLLGQVVHTATSPLGIVLPILVGVGSQVPVMGLFVIPPRLLLYFGHKTRPFVAQSVGPRPVRAITVYPFRSWLIILYVRFG